VAQPLATLKIKLGAIRQTTQSERLAAEVDGMRELMEHTIQSIRGLSFDLAPPVLYNYGFEAALQELLTKVEEHQEIKVRYRKSGNPLNLTEGIQVLLYTMVREIITNVEKHANCKHLTVTVENQKQLTVTLQDDGSGFDASILEKGLQKNAGFGLFSIRERIKHFGGKFTIESSPNKGTRAILTLASDLK
jgi:signal transduction histidine kinase